MGVSHLVRARNKKDSNYYTDKSVVEEGLTPYRDYLSGKCVLCNCDDQCSAFCWVLQRWFGQFNLKKLVGIKFQENGGESKYWVKTQQWGGAESRAMG